MQSTLAGQTAIAAQPSKLKKVAAFIFSFIVALVIITSALGSDSKSAPTSPADLSEYERYARPSAEGFGAFKATTTRDFEIKHVSTKLVEGKYRYFFSSKNLSSTDIPEVHIVLEVYRKDGKAIMFSQHDSSEKVAAGNVSTLFLDAKTGPDPATMGTENNVRSFKYAVYDAAGYLLSTGSGEISPEVLE